MAKRTIEQRPLSVDEGSQGLHEICSQTRPRGKSLCKPIPPPHTEMGCVYHILAIQSNSLTTISVVDDCCAHRCSICLRWFNDPQENRSGSQHRVSLETQNITPPPTAPLPQLPPPSHSPNHPAPRNIVTW